MHFYKIAPNRTRAYVFTFNNPPQDWSPQKVWEKDQQGPSQRIQFLAGQFEIGNSGTRHFQGYVVFHNPQGLPGCRRLLQCPNGHFEPRQGTHQQALVYVSKEDTREPGAEPFSVGDPPQQGQRSDLIDVQESIASGLSEREVAEQHFSQYVKYHAGIRRYIALTAPRRTSFDPPSCYYIWGPAGTGKTRAVFDLYPGEWDKIYVVPLSQPGSVWFDGYDSRVHETVILDDYYHHFRFYFLLRLLDGYPIYVPVKGGFVPWYPRNIYITANIALDHQYPNIPDALALWRRFRRVLCAHNDRWYICTHHNPVPLV